ncbi:MAG: class I SAM-dependent methyltransferase [Thermoplasmata archaeon]
MAGRSRAHPVRASPGPVGWDRIYAERADDELSWFQSHPHRSVRWIVRLARPDDPVLDVGAGQSALAACLVREGFRHVAVIDLSRRAIARSRRRAGPAARSIRFLVGDVTSRRIRLPRVRVWHDRALFHFLTDPADRRRYRGNLGRALVPGGVAVFATFAPDGPTRCSGRPVRRYGPRALARELGPEFRRIRLARERHRTPWGTVQRFLYTAWRRIPSGEGPARSGRPGSRPTGRARAPLRRGRVPASGR